MPQYELGSHSAQPQRANYNTPTRAAPAMLSEDDMVADVDEPPDLQRTPRPSALKLHDSFRGSFTKHAPRCERQTSLLSTALHSSTETSPIDDVPRGMSCVSMWSNNSVSTAELTSDGDITSPGTRTSTPSPPLPPVSSHNMLPIPTKPLDQAISIMPQEGEHVTAILKEAPVVASGEHKVEAGLGRKRCITFACGGDKKEAKPAPEARKIAPVSLKEAEPPKRACTIKFACPTKISTDAPAKPRVTRAASPAPAPRPRTTSKASPKAHRGSDSTVRNPSPVSVRKTRLSDRSRRLSSNSDLARTEAFRFHEFASSEEEVDEWTQESTCHRRPLTIRDTLVIENNLRQLGEEAEEEALDDEEDDDVLEDNEDEDEDELDDDEEEADDMDDDEDDEEEQDSETGDVSSDEGFQTDNEEGFAVSDDDSDAGSDYNWWTPGRSTAATSIEQLDHIRPSGRRSVSESSIGSLESEHREHRYLPEKTIKRRKSRPVNIRVPSPELPDSTDFVCGTLDEDRPLEEAYISALEARRQAKHKRTPQDVDPTFPTSDPEMDEEDEDDEPEHLASESDQHFMLHGQMDALNGDLRGRRKHVPPKRSPAQSPRRLRSPAPIKRAVHRSPPPRKLFGQSPKRMRSPAPIRLRSPPPTRRGSSFQVDPNKHIDLSIQFTGLAERPVPMMTSSLPRTPITQNPPELDSDDEDTPNEFPVRRAIDIKVGLEKKRQRRKEQLYKKMQKHKQCTKEKRCAPGKGAERMREVGLGLAAHKGKAVAAGFALNAPPTPDQKNMHVLSV